MMNPAKSFKDGLRIRKTLRRTLVAGLCLGALAFLAGELLLMMETNFAPSFVRRLRLGLLWSAHAWDLAACHASSLVLLVPRRSWQQWLAPLGAAGRMALTNYLLQAAIVVPVCIGFNLFDRVTPNLGVLLALAVWAVQVPASVLWLRHFRFGPAEWLWRSLTYEQARPMRVRV